MDLYLKLHIFVFLNINTLNIVNKIEYEIKLNDVGRPCIDLVPDHENKPEDKFFIIELARYILQSTYSRMNSPPYDQNTINMMDISIRLLGQISDDMAKILWGSMKMYGDASFIMGQKFHVICDTIEERDKIDNRGILYGDKLYVRQEGLKVLVKDDKMKIYELRGGIDNENWEEII